MRQLFIKEFAGENQTELFTVYEVEENLFQARSGSRIIVLWKANQSWEGASNQPVSQLIGLIGEAIDYYYSTQSISKNEGL